MFALGSGGLEAHLAIRRSAGDTAGRLIDAGANVPGVCVNPQRYPACLPRKEHACFFNAVGQSLLSLISAAVGVCLPRYSFPTAILRRWATVLGGSTYRALGDAVCDRGEWVEAVAKYKIDLKVHPKDPAIWVQLDHERRTRPPPFSLRPLKT